MYEYARSRQPEKQVSKDNKKTTKKRKPEFGNGA